MQQKSEKEKQVKGFATDCQNRHTPDGVRRIGKPDFLASIEKLSSMRWNKKSGSGS